MSRRSPDVLRQFHLELDLQADAVPGAARPAVLVPHGQPEERRAEGGGASGDQPIRPGARAAHRGLHIVQSNVVLDYLARDHRPFRGQDRAGSLARPRVAVVGERRHHQRRQGAPLQPLPAGRSGGHGLFPAAGRGALDFVDKSLEGRDWLVGDACTIADIGCWGRMVFMAEGGMSIDNAAEPAEWRNRLKAMPGFALPYDLIPKKDHEFLARTD